MAGLNLSEADDILKNVYLPPVVELLNNATPLLKYIEKEIQAVPGGKNFTIPLHKSRNNAAGVGRGENGTLPDAGSQGYDTAIVPSKYLYSRIQLSGPVIAATKSNKGAFLTAVESEMKGVTTDTMKAFNRQLHGDGRDVLGFWVSGATTTIIVDDAQGNAGADHFQTGTTLVDFVDSDNSTVHNTGLTATRGAVEATGRSITTSAAIDNEAAGDYFVVSGTLGKQMTGIQAHISDADPVLLAGGLHGVTVAANPDWVAQAVGTDAATAAGRVDLSFSLMQQVFSAIAKNSDKSEKDVKFLLASYEMRDTYVKLCQDERRFYNNMKLDGGFEAVSYNNKPLIPDAQCRRNRIYFVSPDTMAIFRLAELDWMEKDGSMFSRVSNVDAYEATLFVYQELGTKQRNGNGLLRGINEIY